LSYPVESAKLFWPASAQEEGGEYADARALEQWQEQAVKNTPAPVMVESGPAVNEQVTSRSGDPSVGGISRGGEIIHEAGTCRMGDDPKRSVLNKWSQAHEVPNLLVVDAAPFNGNPDKNVTLTIVANAWRAAAHLAEEITKGNV
jgi:choline dehydrogenase-like flavoprotein